MLFRSKALRLRYSEKLAELRPTSSQGVKTVAPAPKLALKQGGIAERAIEARQFGHRSAGPTQPFLVTKEGPCSPTDAAAAALNRCLHPMNDELPGDLGPPKQIDHTEKDGVPAFLDRRRVGDAAEPSYVDLVGGIR